MPGGAQASRERLAGVAIAEYRPVIETRPPPRRARATGRTLRMFRRKLLALFAALGASTVAACAPQTVYVPQPDWHSAAGGVQKILMSVANPTRLVTPSRCTALPTPKSKMPWSPLS